MSLKVPFAVFVSGAGTNLQALIDTIKDRPEFPGRIALVVSDKPEAKGVERARAAGIPVFAKRVKDYPSKAAFELDVKQALESHGVRFVALAGYMRIVGPTLLDAYRGRMVNIHPSLLPAFPGLNAVREALNAGVEQTGVTIHYVDDGVDTGPIIAQEAVLITPGMSEAELLERVHEVEHRLYPKVLEELLTSILNGE
jgi:phosphoribosylglycinamide formyltransferase-1